MENNVQKFDIVVIGGGPAGMMAAGKAAEMGAKVAILEKNDKLGQKLLLTGNGRCNITNAEFNNRKLADQYGKEGKVLLSPFSVFAPKDVIDFFEKIKVKTKIERGNRVFPESNRAVIVLKALLNLLKKHKVDILSNTHVVEFKKNSDENISHILTENKKKITANNYIICTGGKSYPTLGSTGEGYRWAQKLGHSINKPSPALVPMRIKESWAKELQGLGLKNVELKTVSGKIKRFGEMMFTHFGIGGPIVLDMSKEIGELLENQKKVEIILDLKPALNLQELDKRIQKDFDKFANKLFKNSLEDLLPQRLIPAVITFSGISPDKKTNSITKKERAYLAYTLKNIRLTVTELMGFDRARVTTGGVSTKEIDFKTMKSKIIGNLFFAGEIIDLDGPCGGFNLQLCWTTGYVAGQNAAKMLNK